MMLDIRDALKNPGQSYPFSKMIALPTMEILQDQVAFSDVLIKGEVVGAGESMRILGTCSADVHAHCALCLGAVQAHIEAGVDEVFAKNPDVSDPDQYPLEGYEVDLSEIAKESLLLEMPLRFLCGDECQGLCPVCGTNLNDQRCTCHEGRDRKHPFAALSGLLTENEEV